jgi:hypothetical protein
MSIIERFKSSEAIIAATVALIGAVLNFTALSTVFSLPEGMSELAPFLSTIALVVLALLVAYVAQGMASLSPTLLVFAIVSCLGAGIYMATHAVSEIDAQTASVQCVDYPETRIVVPAEPSEQLQRLLDDGAGLENAWCEEEKTNVRRLVKQQNSGQIQLLTLWVVAAEVLLALAVIVMAWLASGSRTGQSRV